jgi:hypothetical protein
VFDPDVEASRDILVNHSGVPINTSERDIIKILFVQVYVFTGGLAGSGAAALASAGGCAAFASSVVAAAAKELDVVSHYIDLGAFGAVLGLPSSVLQLALDEDRVALLLVIGDGLAKFPPGCDVEKVHLFTLGAYPVHRDTELADRDTVVREPEFGVPCKVTGEDYTIKTDHL